MFKREKSDITNKTLTLRLEIVGFLSISGVSQADRKVGIFVNIE